MKVNTHNADILLSATNKSHYPQDDIPEVALAGRSNVGKSSFINTMLNRKKLGPYVGKTRENTVIKLFSISMTNFVLSMYLAMDMLVSLKRTREMGQKMIEEYLTSRENLRAVVSLVDLRHEPSADDVQMYEFLKYYEIPVILGCNQSR